jgi:hypothetical protein
MPLTIMKPPTPMPAAAATGRPGPPPPASASSRPPSSGVWVGSPADRLEPGITEVSKVVPVGSGGGLSVTMMVCRVTVTTSSLGTVTVWPESVLVTTPLVIVDSSVMIDSSAVEGPMVDKSLELMGQSSVEVTLGQSVVSSVVEVDMPQSPVSGVQVLEVERGQSPVSSVVEVVVSRGRSSSRDVILENAGFSEVLLSSPAVSIESYRMMTLTSVVEAMAEMRKSVVLRLNIIVVLIVLPLDPADSSGFGFHSHRESLACWRCVRD